MHADPVPVDLERRQHAFLEMTGVASRVGSLRESLDLYNFVDALAGYAGDLALESFQKGSHALYL
jgi:hypothetical protein